MVTVTRTMSTLCLNKTHEQCPGGLDGVACQCACHKQPQTYTQTHTAYTPTPESDDMGFA
jgi:hypothetical protein